MQGIEQKFVNSKESPQIIWVELQSAKDLIYESNPKQHDLSGIRESIKRYGWQELPKYDATLGAIKAGNGQISAIAQMESNGDELPRGVGVHKDSKKWVIPILCGIDAASDIEAKGYLVDSNNLTLLGGDFTALDLSRAYESNEYLALLEELSQAEEMPVSVNEEDLALLTEQFASSEEEGEEDYDEEDTSAIAQTIEQAEEGELDSRVKKGEIWALGDHRLVCGDSTDKEAVSYLFSERKADMIFTDPPYNVGYDAESRYSYFSEKRTQNKLGEVDNDNMSDSDFKSFLDKIYVSLDIAVKAGRGIYICHADTMGHHFRNAFIDVGWKIQSCLIWKKTVLCFGRSDYHWMHEPILYGWKLGESHVWHGDRKQTTVMEFATDHYNKSESDTDGYVHPTQKPTNLIRYLMGNSTQKGELVCDLFLGSGSTIIAGEQCDRVVYGFELTPKYCEVICQRWENFTGKVAEKVGNLPS